VLPKNNVDEFMNCTLPFECVIDNFEREFKGNGTNGTSEKLSGTPDQIDFIVLDTQGKNLTISNSWLYMNQVNPAHLLINITYNETLAAEAKTQNITYRP
jgi:hypothetical protein